MRSLNWFERWILKGIIRKITYARQLPELFAEIRGANQKRFYEDNFSTREDYLFREYLNERANPKPYWPDLQKVVLKAVLKDQT